MMLSKLKTTLFPYYTNLRGWRTNRKIVVIESDDWGSIRMPSRKVYEKCLKAGYRVDKIAYERYDSLASVDDLELLFELLASFKDCMGNNPIITANALVANPDFEKIRDSKFQDYHFELITDTFKRYPNHSTAFELWDLGKDMGVFFPQSHGREHLNVSMFMEALRQGDKDVLFGFRYEMPGSIPHGNPSGGNKYVESLNFNCYKDKAEKLNIILNGLDLYRTLFGYRSKSFTPPNYIWSSEYDASVSQKGVKFYQGRRKMKEPLKCGKFKYNKHILGERNKYGQRYMVRNAFFEPSLNKNNQDIVDRCLKQVNSAFIMRKPAVICSHRINFVGTIDENNRDKNLILLKDLLSRILKQWPDVEFMNSVQLGMVIDKMEAK